MAPDGIGGQIQAAVWLSNTIGLEVLTFGRAALARENSCKLELAGAHLLYDLTLDNSWVFVSVALMDRGGPGELLFSIGDNAESWKTVCRFVAALERSGLRELQPRPLHIGSEGGPNGWTIA